MQCLDSMAERPKPRWWYVRRAQNLKPATYRCPLCGRHLPALSEHLLMFPEGDHEPPAPRPHQVRNRRPRGRQAPDPRGVAEDPAPPAERVAAAPGGAGRRRERT